MKLTSRSVTCRLRIVSSEADDLEVEDQLEAQLESLTEQCKDELSLIPKMAGELSELPLDRIISYFEQYKVQVCVNMQSGSLGMCQQTTR